MAKLKAQNRKKILKTHTADKKQTKKRLNWKNYLLPKKKAEKESVSQRVDEILYDA